MPHADALPDDLGVDAWERLDAATPSGDFWDELNASPFAHRTPLLDALAEEIGLARGDDPLCTVQRIMSDVYTRFEYSPKSTRVDSPIDDALSARQGVCQDFAHIMIALVRQLGIPCRYVSGYLFQQPDGEALGGRGDARVGGGVAAGPRLGGFRSDAQHARRANATSASPSAATTADVPPTRGVFKGLSAVRSELAVGVSVGTLPGFGSDPTPFVPWMSREASAPLVVTESVTSQQQQQQQQQQQ